MTVNAYRRRSEFEYQYRGHLILIFNHETIVFDQSVLGSIVTNTTQLLFMKNKIIHFKTATFQT